MTGDGEFEAAARGFLADYLEFYPTLGAALGLHLYDGRAGDYSPASIAAYLKTLSAWERRLAGFDPTVRVGQAAHDAALIETTLARERFTWETWREHERNPIWWSYPLDLTTYLKRNYAPLPERLQALVGHLEDVPRLLDEMRGHLRAPLARPIVETAQSVFAGHLAFYETDLPRHVMDLTDPALRGRFESARETACAALRETLAFLETARERAGGDFAIGEAAFCEMLRTGEMVDVPLARLLALGEAERAALDDDLRRTAGLVDRAASPREVMSRMGAQHPAEEDLLPAVRGLLDDLRRFLIERDIVFVPPDVRPVVEETPPFNRWAFAMMDTAGAFEEVATESYYYVTPPESTWPPKRREEWLSKFDFATLKTVSIHEAYPGHFIHFMHLRRAPSMAAKVLTSYSCVEGWAHYSEEMMLGAGVDTSPRFRLSYLAEALVRLIRYLTAIRMHAGDLTVDQATTMFEDQAYMEPLTARQEAVRGTFDPGYLNYTLGKFMVRRLRDDYRAERGPAFALRDFHDRLLGLGAPPVPLARRALLQTDTGQIL
jgi:hypothetical protein